jgi:hypothetical protein
MANVQKIIGMFVRYSLTLARLIYLLRRSHTQKKMPRLLHGTAEMDEPDELTFQQIGSSSAMGDWHRLMIQYTGADHPKS